MPQSTIAQWLKDSINKKSKAQSPASNEPREQSSSQNTLKIVVADDVEAANISAPATADATYTQNTALPALPANVTISRCTAIHIKSFHRLNALLLPIQYPDSFYKETLEDEVISSITRVGLWKPSDSLPNGNAAAENKSQSQTDDRRVVAGIRCRILTGPPHTPAARDPVLYISTIGVLSPYRQLSLASHLLEEIFAVAVEDYDLHAVYAHVWEANQDALEWYLRRGFGIIGEEHGYYQKLAPKTDAWLIKREIRR